MRCTSPRTVGFKSDGRSLSWSPKDYSKEFATFQLPCGKCLSCRLEYARQWAVRSIHEAQMHEKNCFLTLTYDEKHLKSAKLVYNDFQTFAKALRTKLFQDTLDETFPNLCQKDQRKLFRALSKPTKTKLLNKRSISIFVTGEYGDEKKRPHWHALIFNWEPEDKEYKYSNDREDKVYTSQTLQKLWPHGASEFGAVTIHSAGYCARYAAKKLNHGKDGEHEYEPISKKSSQKAIGRAYIEKYWESVFAIGKIILDDGTSCSIPRYYEKWLQKHQPVAYSRYVTQIRQKNMEAAAEKELKLTKEEKLINLKRSGQKGLAVSRAQARKTILEQKFKKLSEHQKL